MVSGGIKMDLSRDHSLVIPPIDLIIPCVGELRLSDGRVAPIETLVKYLGKQ